jgi:uncharacterized protein
LRICLSGGASLLLASCAAGAEVPAGDAPSLELTGRVVDAADILPAAYEARLSDTLKSIKDETSVQLVVATTPDLKGETIDDYSLKLANDWGIGNAERNDGLMILVAPRERKVRIEVGRGLETAVTDGEAKRIIECDMIPHFRAGDYIRALDAGVAGLKAEIKPLANRKAA